MVAAWESSDVDGFNKSALENEAQIAEQSEASND